MLLEGILYLEVNFKLLLYLKFLDFGFIRLVFKGIDFLGIIR